MIETLSKKFQKLRLSSEFKEFFNNHQSFFKSVLDETKWNRGQFKKRLCYWYDNETHFVKDTEDLAQKLVEKYREIMIRKQGVTKERCYLLWGYEDGQREWDNYVNRQKFTKSFEYQSTKRGITFEEWDKWNKSRASTLENFIRRHGEIRGHQLFDEYVERQRYTKSVDYFIEKYGEEEGKRKFEEISKQKAFNLENMIRIYGEEEGPVKYRERIAKRAEIPSISKKEVDFVQRIMNILTPAENESSHTQFPISTDFGDVFFVDYVNEEMSFAVEYFGNFWHANPKNFPADFVIHKKTAKEIWNSDKIRIDCLKSKFKRVFIVWESEEDDGFEEIRRYVETTRGC